MPNAHALVTGASRGLGKVFAQALAARKHDLFLVARSTDKLTDVATDLRERYATNVETAAIDLSAPNAAQKVFNELTNRNLSIDLLVNNAGFGLEGEFYKLDLSAQVEMINLHNTAVVELTHLLLPAMITARNGGIINISSMAGMQAVPYAALYSATKSFLTTFSLALEREVGKHNIAVVTVCPGRLKAAPKGDETNGPPRKKFPGGEQAHEEVVDLTLKMLDDGGGLLIPGVVNKVANVAERFFPRRLVTKGIGKLTRPKPS
jgi:short-subunit dehydrogenase